MKKIFSITIFLFAIFQVCGIEKLDKDDFSLELLEYHKIDNKIELELEGTNLGKESLVLQLEAGSSFINKFENCLFFIPNIAFLKQTWKLADDRFLKQIEFKANERKTFLVEILNYENAADLIDLFEKKSNKKRIKLDEIKIVTVTFIFTKFLFPISINADIYEKTIEEEGKIYTDSFILN